ncbi:MAG: aminodeoxychorismate/anthranilate synthase component II [Bdellovibrio sp.]|nr:aminodeoxychorismate/anthranilate synthase component II [Bdellovibrio sp.]
MPSNYSKSRIDNRPSSQVVIIDFDDSFTYNVANSFYEILKINPKVLHWKKFHLEQETVLKNTQILIWGPGPGHPSEYEDILLIMQKAFASPKIFNLGICLGHQLYWKMIGGQILPSRVACHGESIEMTIPPWGIFPEGSHHQVTKVQRYNSLCVKKGTIGKQDQHDLIVNDEVIMSAGPNFLTMQFHPESIGTSCPKLFFAVVEQFRYNLMNECKIEN